MTYSVRLPTALSDAEQLGDDETHSERGQHAAPGMFAHLSLGLVECGSALGESERSSRVRVHRG